MKSLLAFLPLLLTLSSALPSPRKSKAPAPAPTPVPAPPPKSADDEDDGIGALPLIIWHGLGDSYGNPGMKEVAALAQDVTPGTYVHTIRLGDDADADRQASFLGNVTEQIDAVCDQIKADRILSTAPALNALGFSQGGQFLRGLAERCDGMPPVYNLVTFGSQHNGITAFQQCESFFDIVCRSAEAILRRGRWSGFAQSKFVPAQYFRDPEEMDEYLRYSNFLADINNERVEKNGGYKRNFEKLHHFAMVMFEDDTVSVPKESAYFADYYKTAKKVVPLREREIYKEDWIGLKTLDEAGKLSFESVPGEHMTLTDEVLTTAFKKYFAPVDLSKFANYTLERCHVRSPN
ncbi:hypothetical protein KEM56_004716 [Ascosphaera pollenicola]|nr:hypothetical protein KEM56_004716 [Ascosphaera pollenicola]